MLVTHKAATETSLRWCRVGTYSGHAKPILQMMCLGDHLLSLGQDKRLLLWKLGSYAAPLVSSLPASDMLAYLVRTTAVEICMLVHKQMQ